MISNAIFQIINDLNKNFDHKKILKIYIKSLRISNSKISPNYVYYTIHMFHTPKINTFVACLILFILKFILNNNEIYKLCKASLKESITVHFMQAYYYYRVIFILISYCTRYFHTFTVSYIKKKINK